MTRADLTRPAASRLMSTGSPFQLPIKVREGFSDIVATVFPGAKWFDLPNLMRTNLDQTATLMGAIPHDDIAVGTTVHDPRVGPDGHLNVICGRQQVDQGRHLIGDMRYPILGPFSVFPNGIRILTEQLGQSYMAADDKVAWLNANKPAVDAAHADAYDMTKPATSLAGQFMILGNGSVVRVIQHDQRTQPDGTALTTFQLQTTSIHNFDGVFTWGYKTNVSTGEVISLGVQAGKHPWYDIDTLNVWAGGALRHAVDNAALAHIAARDHGDDVTTGDRSIVADASLRCALMLLTAGDAFSPVVQWLRENGPPNTRAEFFKIDGPTLEKLAAGPASAWETAPGLAADTSPGITVDGEPQTFIDATISAPATPPGTDQLPGIVNQATEYTRSPQAWARIRDAVTKLAADKLGTDWVTLSRTELMNKLLADPEALAHIKATVTKELLDGAIDTIRQGIGNLNNIDPAAIDQLMAGATQTFHEQVTAPLLAPDGAIRAAIDLQILDEQVKVLDVATVAANLNRAETAAASQRAAVAQLKQQKPADPGQEQAWEQAVQEAEDEQTTMDEEAARLTEQHEDLTTPARRDEIVKREKTSSEEVFPP